MPIADVFVACDSAVDRGIPLRHPDPGEQGSPFQNWFADCLNHAGIGNMQLNPRAFPDFELCDSPEGFELKGLEVPGRDASFDANSQLPKGTHAQRDVYYVFGRYPPRAAQLKKGLHDLLVVHGSLLSLENQPMHKNTSVKGGGSFGDILIRVRKMFAPPTPYAILGGAEGVRTLVVPESIGVSLAQDGRLKKVGELFRTEASVVISKILVDLSDPQMKVETLPNPSANTQHVFHAYRTLGQPDTPVTLSLATGTVQVIEDNGGAEV